MTATSVNAIDRRDPLPLRHQVRRALVNEILAGNVKVGERLPSETELCQAFGVSRNTLRQAVDEMVAEGLLVRNRPHGTFVANGAVEGDLRNLRSIWEDLRRLGLEPSASLQDASIQPASEEVAAYLNVPAFSPVVVVTRLFSADGQPIAYDIAHFPSPEFDWLIEEDLTQSWYGLVEGRGGLTIHHARQTLTATALSAEIARQLRVSRTSPALLIRRQTYSTDNALFNYSSAWFVGQTYHFSIVLPRASKIPLGQQQDHE